MTEKSPLQSLVVGVDFSESSELAVRLAMNIARYQGAGLHLVHVGVVPDQSVGGRSFLGLEEMQELVNESFKENRQLIEELRERFDGQGVEIDHSILGGHPDTGLCRAATELGADLLVVGSHGRTGISHFFLGSVAERVVRMSAEPVLVARPGGDGAGGFRKILVPTDFSEFAERALDLAQRLAAPEARIDVYHSWQMPPGAVLHYGAPPSTRRELDALRKNMERRAQERGEVFLQGRQRGGLRMSFHTREASPVHGILDRLEEEGGYDLVVMGSHGRRGFRRFILGSVAETTVRHAPCSVVVVPVLRDRR